MTKKGTEAIVKKENIFLLTGENDYELKKFRKAWENQAVEKYGEYNVFRFDIEERSVADIVGELFSPPFFGDGRRVFFLENFPPAPPVRPFSEKKKIAFSDLASELSHIPEECVAVLVSPKPDKRLAAYKIIEKIVGKTYSFPLWERDRNGYITSAGLLEATEWTQKQVILSGGEIPSSSARFLVKYIGADPWRLVNEIEKLVSYSKSTGRPIAENDIVQLSLFDEETGNFAFSSALQDGKISDAIHILESLIHSGESPSAVFARDILPTIRTLFLTRLALDDHLTAEDVGIHPFAFQKAKPAALRFSRDILEYVFQMLFQFDCDSKTGKTSITSEKSILFLLEMEKLLIALLKSGETEQKNEK